MQVKNAKPKAKPYKLADGGGLYLEIMPTGSKLWRMKFKQASRKVSRLSFDSYPNVSLTKARAARTAARHLRASDIDPSQARRDAKLARAAAAAHTFEALARDWLRKTAADRAATIQAKNTSWLEKNSCARTEVRRYQPFARRRALKPTRPRPATSIAQVSGSGTARMLKSAA
jgi:hypothetical protein